MSLQILAEGKTGYGILLEKDAGETLPLKHVAAPILKEGESPLGDNVLRIEIDCILQKANVQNRNGRIYPKAVLEREVKKYLALINSSSSFGENGHPETPTISLNRGNLSHLIKKIWWNGDTLYGTLEIITSKGYADHGGLYCEGDQIANLLERGYKLGISSRGLGSVKTIGGKNIVQDDFELVCWDIVSSPSTPDAFLFQETIKAMNENAIVDTVINEIFSEKQEKIKKFLYKNQQN